MKKFLIPLALVAALSCSHESSITLAEPFVDGCVLAKDKPVHVYGAGEGQVTVQLMDSGRSVSKAKVRSADGSWTAVLPAMPAGGPYELVVKSAGSIATVSDVYVGRVVLLAGQSNAQFKLQESNTPRSEWKADSLLREYSLPRFEWEPYSPADGWIRCTEENAGLWPAIGYLAGTELRKATGEAVAVINCYQGASVIESWVPEDIALKPEYAVPDEDRHGDFFHELYGKFNKPGTLWRETFCRIVPYSVSDVVWYQGESNTGKGDVEVYQDLFGELLQSWRVAFDDPSLPFVVVQLPDYDGGNEYWHHMQDIQAGFPELYQDVVTVPSRDVCESDDVHPKSKAALSARIAAAILGM